MGQPHDHQNHDLELIVLEVRRYGEPPIEVEVPANATGKYAAEVVSQRIGIEGSVSLSLLPPKGRPTSTTLVVAGLADPDLLVEVEAIAVIDGVTGHP